jgi:hypothetical protein
MDVMVCDEQGDANCGNASICSISGIQQCFNGKFAIILSVKSAINRWVINRSKMCLFCSSDNTVFLPYSNSVVPTSNKIIKVYLPKQTTPGPSAGHD